MRYFSTSIEPYLKEYNLTLLNYTVELNELRVIFQFCEDTTYNDVDRLVGLFKICKNIKKFIFEGVVNWNNLRKILPIFTQLEVIKIDTIELNPSNHTEVYQFIIDSCLSLQKLIIPRRNDQANAEEFFSGSDIVVER
jgi:hypothetical protein